MKQIKIHQTPIRIILLFLMVLPAGAWAEPLTAEKIIETAWDHMRGTTSVSVVQMIVHRTEWERRSTIKAWTKGREKSIFHVIAPKKDKGNGTLKIGREMWTYNPKINRVVKIPPSMMSQSWMGSDFSNNDLAKADSIINDYTHEITETLDDGGMKIYSVRSVPKPDAPVIWGLQTLKIREDGVLMEEIFYDEDLEPVKILTTEDIEIFDGKPFPRKWTMRAVASPYGEKLSKDEYTLLIYDQLSFDIKLDERQFKLNALKNPMR